jgi:secreted trypsin-like serine protease
VGYGPQDDEDLTLTSIDLTIKSIALCNAKYDVGKENRNYWEIFDSLPTKFNGGSIFCASNVGTDDGTCRGDSGGPALFSDGFKNQQLGVVHGSITSCDGSRFPSIFVRIDNPDVFNWISKVTSSGSVSGMSF